MSELIQPRTLKGFRDYLPEAMLPREALIDTARRVYRSYGFSPIDTPALEYLEILSGKGSDETDKQLYKFQDHGGRDVGLRFDLTVPLARFAAQHIGTLGTPFKRYHIASVWRGENTQRGRYREFMQCDFDTIGTESSAADIETVLVIHDLFHALGLHDFTIRINNRQVLTGLLERLSLVELATPILRALDKLAKIGRAGVAAELVAAGLSAGQADEVLKLPEISAEYSAGTEESTAQLLSAIEPLVSGTETGERGLTTLRELTTTVMAAGVAARHLNVDVAICRGLDYYTGTVFETFLDELPGIGSVCSGGRYDNLAGLYTKQRLPGIGASLGLDRLLAALEELGRLPTAATPAQVFIPYFAEDQLPAYLRLAAGLRGKPYTSPEGTQGTINVEVYPEAKKLGQQLKYADRRGFRVALVLGGDEWAAGQCQVKDLARGETENIPIGTAEQLQLDPLLASLQRLLAQPV